LNNCGLTRDRSKSVARCHSDPASKFIEKILGKTALKPQKHKVIHSLLGRATGATPYDITNRKLPKTFQKHPFLPPQTASSGLSGHDNCAKPAHRPETSPFTAGESSANRTTYSQLIHNPRLTRFICRERAERSRAGRASQGKRGKKKIIGSSRR